MRSLLAFILLIASLTLASPAWAQDWKGMGRLEGKVLDSDGKPIEGAVVRLELPGRGSTELKTDKKGRWSILGLAGGTWNLDITAEGFDTKQLFVPVRESSANRSVEVTLARTAPKGPPPEIMQWLQRGDEAYRAEDYAAARSQYEAALAKYAALPDARKEALVNLHMQIARCFSQEKNYRDELEHLQFVLDADPGNVDIRKLMALEALQGGLLDQGLALLKSIDESALQNADLLYNVAVAFYNSGRIDETIMYATKAVAVNPAHADGYFLRGNAHLNQNRIDQAKADYRKFVEVAPPGDPRIPIAQKALEQLK